MRHGTRSGYINRGCRCEGCCQAHTDYVRERRGVVGDGRPRVDRDRLSDLLHELFPYGLTDDCPAARERARCVS